MKKRAVIFLLFYAFVLQSCSVDFQQDSDSRANVPIVIIPDVINSAVPDSISTTIVYPQSKERALDSDYGSVKTIIESSFHIGFPDLIKYKDTWYASMRYSEGHLPRKIGYIIIAKSKDLKNWENEQIFVQEGYDLRDPKLFLAKDSLYVHFNSTTINPYGDIRNDYISKYEGKEEKWSSAKKINKNTKIKSWFWRITYNEGLFYTIAYKGGEPLKLFSSDNGTNFKEIYRFSIKGRTTEATLRFYGEKAYMLLRMDDRNALFGEAPKNNLTNWIFKDVNIHRLGGPNFLKYENVFLLGGREHKSNKTKLYTYNPYSDFLNEVITFPSVLDTGYPGMVLDGNILYLLYFSGASNGKHHINIAIMDLDKIKENRQT